jgi:hypothetical protein
MKTPILVAILMLSLTSYSQNKAVIDMLDKQKIQHRSGEVHYETIDSSLIGINKDVIFKAAKRALAETFVDSKEVIQLIESEDGNIIAKGKFPWGYPFFMMGNNATVRLTMVVTARDGRFRIIAKDFIDWQSDNSLGGPTIGDISTLEKMVKAGNSFESKFWSSFDSAFKDFVSKLKKRIHDYSSHKDDF